MDCRIPKLLRASVTAIALGFATHCVAAAPVEHVRTDAGVESDSLALEQSLTESGNGYLAANDYARAEAAFREALQSAEQHGGRESDRVLAPLTGLGTTLARAGHHHDAVPLLQRAVAITRTQFGMFDLRQQDLLKTLAGSLTALQRQTEAQDALVYRVRVAEKTWGEGSPQVIPWLCDLGNWFADIGKTPKARMTFQVALNIVGTKDSLNVPIMVEPLRGIARVHMVRPSYPDKWRKAPWPALGCGRLWGPMPPPECKNPAALDASGRHLIEPRKLNPEGEDALKRALEILESDPGASVQTWIETLLQMGDWYQIKKSPREALTYYQRAWQVISKTPGLSRSVSTALDVPLRVYYPTPDIVANVPRGRPEDAQSHFVQLEFTVAADGSVSGARLVEHNTRAHHAQEIFDAVRASRFRPKFVNGQAVAAPAITYREIFWTDAPRE